MKCCHHNCNNAVHSYYVSKGGMLMPKYIWPLCKEHVAKKTDSFCFNTLKEAELARI